MITAEWLGAISSVVAALAAAIGLFAIWRTLRNAEEQSKNSIYQLVTTRMSSINEKFLEYPELRPYFYADQALSGGSDPTSTATGARVNSMCELLFDHAEVVLGRPHIMGTLGESYQAYFCDLIEHSPAMRDYWRIRRQWYVAPLRQIFDAAVARSGGNS